jgi:integral membrane sensor domain MASE1
MKIRNLLGEKHQFRVVLCGHKAAEAAAVCLMLMVQGQLTEVTAAHLLIASKTGLLAVLPVLGITFTHHARHFINRWISSLILGICTFAADAVIHQSHYPGEYSEAALTGIGAFAFSLLISFTPIGKRIDELAETFLSRQPAHSNLI